MTNVPWGWGGGGCTGNVTLNGKSVFANVLKDFEIALPSLSVLIRGVKGDLTQTDETPSC